MPHLTVWADKTGRLPEKEDNEAMRQGRDFEPYVANRFVEAVDKKVRRKNQILRNPDYPFALANIDRMIVGENAGLECKTTSILNLKKFKNGEFPETYYCQCVHYMAVTGAVRWHLAVLVLNQGFYPFTIERDDAEIQALMQAEKEFWKYVEKDTPPPLDGLEATSEAIKTIYKDNISNSDPVDLFGRDKLVQEWFDIKNEIKKWEEKQELIKQVLQNDLGQNEIGLCGDFEVRWKGQSRNTFDAKTFAKDHPEIDLSGYYKQSSFRKFEIKERK